MWYLLVQFFYRVSLLTGGFGRLIRSHLLGEYSVTRKNSSQSFAQACRHYYGWQWSLGAESFSPRIEGHWAGVKVVDRIVTLSRELKLEALTLYSFSDENWNRPSLEIKTLMKILDFYLKKELKRMKDENIRFNTIGHVDDLPETIQKLIRQSIDETSDNTGMILTLALSYGGRQEIIDAVKNIAKQVSLGQIRPEEIDFLYLNRFFLRTLFPIRI